MPTSGSTNRLLCRDQLLNEVRPHQALLRNRYHLHQDPHPAPDSDPGGTLLLANERLIPTVSCVARCFNPTKRYRWRLTMRPLHGLCPVKCAARAMKYFQVERCRPANSPIASLHLLSRAPSLGSSTTGIVRRVRAGPPEVMAASRAPRRPRSRGLTASDAGRWSAGLGSL